jgi:hypothetical protein
MERKTLEGNRGWFWVAGQPVGSCTTKLYVPLCGDHSQGSDCPQLLVHEGPSFLGDDSERARETPAAVRQDLEDSLIL